MEIDIHQIRKEANELHGCLSELRCTSGRRRHTDNYEDPLLMSDNFRSDEARILSSKARRRQAEKTQVFTTPETPLIRSRLSHVDEVVACSIVAADILGLNIELVRAAAFGHDIGHVPFGHQGEMWLKEAMGKPHFCHEIMGVIVAQKIERRGRGLNLTHETLEAMMCHSGDLAHYGMSQEAWVLRYTDKMAYLFHDFNDIVERLKYPVSQEIRDIVNLFGRNQRERTTTAIAGLVVESAEFGRVRFEDSELARAFHKLRQLMYKVYNAVTQQDVDIRMSAAYETLERLKIADPFLLLVLMTDNDVRKLTDPAMRDMQAFNRTTLCELTPYLQDIGQIDLCDPDLDW